MKTVKKYELPKEKNFSLKVPFNSEILQMFCNGQTPYLLVLEDTDGRSVERKFVTIAQGDEMPTRFNVTHFVGSYGIGEYSACIFEER